MKDENNFKKSFWDIPNSILKSQIHCLKIGLILEIDTIKLRARARLTQIGSLILNDIEYDDVPYDDILDIPLNFSFLASSKGGVKVPIQVGDFCLLGFLDRDNTNWKNTDLIEEIPLNTSRMHDISDAIILDFCSPDKMLGGYDFTYTEVFYGEDASLNLNEVNVILKKGENQLIMQSEQSTFSRPVIFQQNITIQQNVIIEGNSLELNGVKITGDGGKLLVNGKEVAVMGGTTVGSPTTQTITESGQ